ncbi:MAG: endo-1,4-beta-xylanase [Alteromonadaceae bacterium]|nr:endo-1,4-beta-xylanase [Alteromonadaceae bacterium]
MYKSGRRLTIVSVIALLSACGGGGGGGGGSSTTPPPVDNTPPPNVAPVADAGADQSVDELTLVTLSGSGTDSDGSISSYAWSQTAGTAVTLNDAGMQSASFNAPDLSADEVLTFQLTVTDDDGDTGTDVVDITVRDITPPTNPPETMQVPEGGILIIPSDAESSAAFWAGNGSEPVGTMTVVDVEHEHFSKALELDITNPSGTSWNGQAQIFTNAGLQSGDVVLLHFYFRSLSSQYETGTGFTSAVLEGPSPDFVQFINRRVDSASEWVEYFIPAEITQDFDVGELAIKFGLGAGDRPQSYQIGGIELYNYQTNKSLEELPVTSPTYAGRDPDAAWRADAAQRIETHRKGDFTLTLQDADGNEIPATDIHVTLTKHAYHFGSAIVSNRLIGTDEDSLTYQQKVLELFNQAGPENDLKWAPWIGEWGEDFSQQTTLAGLQWLKDHDIYARGHVLVWPSKRNLPDMMQQYLPDNTDDADPQALVEVEQHIDDITLATADLLSEWDVLNEPFDNHYLMDAFGDEIMVDWFEQTRENLPDHKLYINDYSILSSAGQDVAHQQHYQDTIAYLLEQGAPLDGIGFQSHFSDILTDIPTVYAILERFHQAFPDSVFRSTEFDIRTNDEQLQADYTRDFMTLFFSHPATVGIQLWGFWAQQHWYPEAAMYDEDWREKPNAVVWKDLIFNQWHSEFNGQTDANGQFSERGFYGEYTASFTHEGSEHTLNFVLEQSGDNQIVLKLPE